MLDSVLWQCHIMGVPVKGRPYGPGSAFPAGCTAARQNARARATALRVATMKPDSDSAYIRSLLGDDILRTTRVRSWREPHPFGSTVARETLAEAELPTEVTIDADDVETLPRRVRLKLAKGGARFA